MKLKLKKGDLVQVIAGNDKGAVGRILEIYPDKMRVLVEGVNVRKKHQRPTQTNPKGGIVSKEMPIHYSNVMILDSDKNPTRIGIRFEEKDGKNVKIRYSKKNGKDL
ncbi:50S ribosomal protein L24 [Bacteroidetes/Chlorobi group bacterium Naka2016]|jgi:large subunit ribosomal protein L24|nr:MAG: 50S ribosomal protein L24 [Bacteroidetes/Chlorobi group bacterium Naka2016]